jgi:hypothetical protein
MDTIFGLDGITNFKEIDSIDEIVDYYQMKFMDSNFDIELNEPSFKPTYQTDYFKNEICEKIDSEEKYIEYFSKIDTPKIKDEITVPNKLNELENVTNQINNEINDKKVLNVKKGRKKNVTKMFELIKPSESSKFKPDNIRIKIKGHFHNFIINFFNEFIRSYFNYQRFKFRKIAYDITKDITIKGNINLMDMKLGDFLSQNVSSKYKCDVDTNKQIVKNLKYILKDKSVLQLFDYRYSDFFTHIYLSKNKKAVKKYFNLKKNINFFDDLLQKLVNEDYKNAVNNMAKNHYIQNFNKQENKLIEKKPNFINLNYLNKKRK